MQKTTQSSETTVSLDTSINVKVEKSVAECLKVMSEHTKKSEGELVNTAMKRFIATHSDYFPKKKQL